MESYLDLFTDICSGFTSSKKEKKNCVIKNGEFISLDGWTVVNQTGSQGSWVNQTGPVTTGIDPEFIVPFPAPCPASGTYALFQSNLGTPSSSVLYQDILVPQSCSDGPSILSFNWFAVDANLLTALTPQASMDLNLRPNFQFRVDLVPVDYTDWFAQPSDEGIIKNLVPPSVSGDLSVDSSGLILTSAPWIHAAFNLKDFECKQVRLAFRVVSNSCSTDALFVGLSNVRFTTDIKHLFGSGITVPTNGIAPLTPCTEDTPPPQLSTKKPAAKPKAKKPVTTHPNKRVKRSHN